jgi:N,N'-diacetylchitobiose transport system substrate-binding protein
VKRKLIAAIGIAGMMFSVAACGSDDKSGGSDKGADAKELTVWLTVDAQNNWPDLVKQADTAIEAKHPGIKIKHEYYGWPDKNTKLDAVLATDKAPDVVEMGNTEMLGYMVKGAFAPLDASKFENSAAWLDGLKASVTYDGKTYGVPYYAGGRVGNWRKDIAASVGVKTPPKTYQELTSALDKIQKKEGSKFSAWYQPTRDWYAAMSFVYDAGGSIAKQEGGQWKANLSSPESQKGLTEFKNVVDKYMHGDKTKDESDRYIVYGQGKSGMIFGAAWEGATAEDPKSDKTGKLKGNLENFVMPGRLRPRRPGEVEGAGPRRRVDQRVHRRQGPEGPDGQGQPAQQQDRPRHPEERPGDGRPGHRGRVQLVRPDGAGLGPGREGPGPADHAAEHRHRQEVGGGRREGSGRRDRQGHQHQVT